ncbi:hypothetical protein IJI17_02555 [Candidatus Saccharibacteria bacterium]|nr:hypothetical protein [Candidatus Saccharibacteria bacterium]
MYRLSTIIEEVFRKYLPVAERRKIILNLDFPDVTKRVDRPSRVRGPLNKAVGEAVARAKRNVSIMVGRDNVRVMDDGRALTPDELAELSEPEHIEVKSRVGFGTEVLIWF